MSFTELNAVEHFIIQKLSGKNPNRRRSDVVGGEGRRGGLWFVPVEV